jgi:hypothetical protein
MLVALRSASVMTHSRSSLPRPLYTEKIARAILERLLVESAVVRVDVSPVSWLWLHIRMSLRLGAQDVWQVIAFRLMTGLAAAGSFL